jgi:hypothetical protein
MPTGFQSRGPGSSQVHNSDVICTSMVVCEHKFPLLMHFWFMQVVRGESIRRCSLLQQFDKLSASERYGIENPYT